MLKRTTDPPRSDRIQPPAAKIKPTRFEEHGRSRTDNYYWLRDRDDPEVIAYLEAENAYTDAMLEHTQSLQEALFREFKTRIKQNDESVPYRLNGYYYFSRTVEDADYAIHYRRKDAPDAAEEVLLDVNETARGHDFCSVSGLEVSLDNRLAVYGVDTVGRRFYDLRFRNLATGEDLLDIIPQVTGDAVWANDNRTVFYTRQHAETLRSYQVWRHVLGTEPSLDVLDYQEDDDAFEVGIDKSKSDRYLFISCVQTVSTEYRYLDADTPEAEFQVIAPRRRDHEYHVGHFGDHFYIKTNLAAKNFRLVRTPVGAPGIENWADVITHRDDTLVEDFDTFRDYLVVEERRAGLPRLRVIPWSGEESHVIEFGEPAYSAGMVDNYETDTRLVRYSCESPATPDSVYDYDMATREKKLLKRDEILGGFDSANYTVERLQATARDETRVPISLVYRTELFSPGANPLLLLGYGSYGISEEADFSPYVVSLLDRGFVFAIAHVRGGEEMGRHWYESGKLLRKKNTFCDFIDCAEHLIARRYADPSRLFATGGSAGGLLMGAVANMRPDLWRGIYAAVPFVDVVTTMLDSDIPLTTGEYDEWGDPGRKEFYDYIRSYSPYDNVEAQAYPAMLILTGIHDSQVQYWEPAKWVAKLRALKTDNNALLLKTEMEAGHGGVSGRDKRYREQALIYAFLLDQAGITE